MNDNRKKYNKKILKKKRKKERKPAVLGHWLVSWEKQTTQQWLSQCSSRSPRPTALLALETAEVRVMAQNDNRLHISAVIVKLSRTKTNHQLSRFSSEIDATKLLFKNSIHQTNTSQFYTSTTILNAYFLLQSFSTIILTTELFLIKCSL